MEHKQVFISYKSEEFDEANWVRNVLETNGISCWMAPMCITGGSSYAVEIPQAIRNCKVFVLILSQQSQESKWVPREVDQAINENKIIMPFMLENCKLKDDFNFYLTNVQRYAAYESKMTAIEKMLREIKAILGIQEELKPEESVKETPTKEEHKVEKPKKEIKKKKSRQKGEKKGNKPIVILGGIIIAIALLLTMCTVIKKMNQLTIAGVVVNKDDTTVTIKNATITTEDMGKIVSMEELWAIQFENCKITPGLMKEISKVDLYRLEMVSCSLSDEHIKNIDFEKLESLYCLNLAGNPDITDLDGVVHVADTLEEVNLSGCSVTSLTFLDESTHITKIDVSGNQLTSLKGIEKNIELKEIYAQDNQLPTLDGLDNATILETVNIRNNQVSDLSTLSKSSKTLKYLYIDHNPVSNLYAISECVEIMHLDADNCGLVALDALSKYEKLVYLSVAGNGIINLSGIEKNKELYYLDASNNQILSTTTLKEIPFTDSNGNKGIVNLSNNKISSLELAGNTDMNLLDLHGNSIWAADALYKCKIRYLYLNYEDNLDFSELAKAEIENIDLVNVPLDQQVSLKEIFESANITVSFLETEDVAGSYDNLIPEEMKEEK